MPFTSVLRVLRGKVVFGTGLLLQCYTRDEYSEMDFMDHDTSERGSFQEFYDTNGGKELTNEQRCENNPCTVVGKTCSHRILPVARARTVPAWLPFSNLLPLHLFSDFHHHSSTPLVRGGARTRATLHTSISSTHRCSPHPPCRAPSVRE